MSSRAESVLDSVLRRSPAQPVFRWRASRHLAVLAYHGVDDAERFSAHLETLTRSTHVVSLDDVLAAFGGGRGLPRRAVLITFDDGHRSVADVAMPMLRDRGLPAVAFVVPSVVGSDRPFWWTEVVGLAERGGTVEGITARTPRDLVRALKRLSDPHRRAALDELRRSAREPAPPMPQLTPAELLQMESAGIAIGNHTWAHPCLSRCAPDVKRHEIVRAHEQLAGWLGQAPVSFAYPDGDHDPVSSGILAELGYQVAFLFDHRLSAVRPRDALAVSRLRVNSTTTLDRFQTIASGLHPSLHRARGGV